ncbi:hypothetical protein TSUD_10470 [Trifolium subterraneum]|nr:hypothetical protein TSUD_10470 [Trifolium subterraneum]
MESKNPPSTQHNPTAQLCAFCQPLLCSAAKVHTPFPWCTTQPWPQPPAPSAAL